MGLCYIRGAILPPTSRDPDLTTGRPRPHNESEVTQMRNMTQYRAAVVCQTIDDDGNIERGFTVFCFSETGVDSAWAANWPAAQSIADIVIGHRGGRRA